MVKHYETEYSEAKKAAGQSLSSVTTTSQYTGKLRWKETRAFNRTLEQQVLIKTQLQNGVIREEVRWEPIPTVYEPPAEHTGQRTVYAE